MSYTDYDFPHTSLYQSDLREILAQMDKLTKIVNAFVNVEKVTFADPILWNIATQYSKNTIVLSVSGDAYLSKQAVPAGVQLDNEDYWQEIFNFADYVRTANENLTINVEQNTTRSEHAYHVDDWLLWNDVLYKVIEEIAVDDLLVVDANVEHFTVEDFIKAWIRYANATIQQYKDDVDASELAYRQQLAQDIANTTASLQAQLDVIIAGATVDSEVLDARVGADGITYNTLGNAIRTQFADKYNFDYVTDADNVLSKNTSPVTLDTSVLQWEVGTIIAGQDSDNNKRLRTHKYLDLTKFALIIATSANNTGTLNVAMYDDDFNFVENLSTAFASYNLGFYSAGSNHRYARLVYYPTNGTTVLTVDDAANLTLKYISKESAGYYNEGVRNTYMIHNNCGVLLDGSDPDYPISAGKNSGTGFDALTRYCHVEVPKCNATQLVFKSDAPNMQMKLGRLTGTTWSMFDDTYHDVGDEFIIENEMAENGTLYAIFHSTKGYYLDNDTPIAYPFSFVDYYYAKYGKTEEEMINNYFDYDSVNALPDDKKLWHIWINNLSAGLIHGTPQGLATYGIQSIYVPYPNGIGTINITLNDPVYNLKLLLFDINKKCIGWTAGGVGTGANRTRFETALTLKAGYSLSNVRYVSYVLIDTTLTAIDIDTLDFSTIDISVEIRDAVPGLSTKRIRIGEYNIGHFHYGTGTGIPDDGYANKVYNYKKLFTDNKPDVQILCEFTDQLKESDPSISANSVLFNPIFPFSTSLTTRWNEIKSIYPLNSVKSNYILDPIDYPNSKPYVIATVDLGGKRVTICAVHFLAVLPDDSPFPDLPSARAYELSEILNVLTDYPDVIIAGDFNAATEEEEATVKTTLNTANYTTCNLGYLGRIPTWNYTTPSKVLDMIAFKGSIKMNDYKVLSVQGTLLTSDHLPTFADLIVY